MLCLHPLRRLAGRLGPLAAGALAALPSLLSLACSSSGSASPPAVEAGPPPFDAGPRIDDTTAQTDRTACMFARGATPVQTLGASTPIGPNIPIDNIVVIMMENHSFDSYLGHLNQFGNRTDVESAPANASNPDTSADGGVQPWAHAAHLCSNDTDHGWAGTHIEINGGLMNGFAQRNEGTAGPTGPDGGPLDPVQSSGARSLWWYDQTDIPFYYQVANTFAVADHYHCAVPGPTWPNRRFLYAGTSWGGTVTDLPLVLEDESKYPYPSTPATVLDELEANSTSWMYYGDGLPVPALLYTDYTTRWKRDPIASIAEFMTAAKEGKLPSVAFVDPFLPLTGSGEEQDEHPPGDIEIGQQFVSSIVQAVMASPQWAHSAIFITHDEHGGFYDHVPPPPACVPDSIAPILVDGDTTDAGFDTEGVRVILLAVSPYSKKGYVGHHVYDHTSITRFIEARFNLPALTARDANSEPPTDLFDFTDPPAFLTPPTLMTPPVNPAMLDYCATLFGDGGA
jgi:phospholipase C